jgi:two-component system OmpR family response regulator/two-component system response regulator QseB
MRILLVEDDVSLGTTLQSWLQMDGYAVDWVRRGDDAVASVRGHAYQCVLLDRGLPGLDGDQVLARLRAGKVAVPVIMITARDTLHDRVGGLDLGADDYLVKPFDLEELSARIRAALRREAHAPAPLLQHGGVALDPSAKGVTLAGVPVSLTSREFALLHALLRRPGAVLSRSQIEEALYGWGEEVESNAIEVHVSNLRKKLGAKFILTLRNRGYALGPAGDTGAGA